MDHRNSKSSLPNILLYSTIIKNRWKTLDKLGQGAFGEIYAGIDLHTCNEVAVKVERCDSKKMVLKLEVIVLKKLQKSNQVVRYLHSGRQDHFNYLVMERLGDNIATLLKRTERGCFSLCTVVKLAVQMVDSLESIHNLGYIHRDVKPSNFCLYREPEKAKRICLIDFNLARRYILSTGAIRPPRKHAGFRGTARYASIQSHHSKELARRDDLWSVFYILVEFATGLLPWKRLKDKKHIGELKERFTNAELVKDLPPEFLLFMQHLHSLSYEDKPDYGYLRSILCRISAREGYPSDSLYDWEDDEEEAQEEEESSEEEEEGTAEGRAGKGKGNGRKRKKNRKSRADQYRHTGTKKKKKRRKATSSVPDEGNKRVNDNENNSSGATDEGRKESSSSDREFGYHKYKRKKNNERKGKNKAPNPSKNTGVQNQSKRKEHQYMAKYLSPSANKQKCCTIL